MRKKFFIIFILIIVIIFSYLKNVYGAKVNGINCKIVSIDAKWGSSSKDTETRALETLSGYGYDGVMQDELKWETKISFCTNSKIYNDTNKNGKYWKIKIGNTFIDEEIDFNTAKQKYACEKSEPTSKEVEKALKGKKNKYVQVFSYNAVIIAKKDLTAHDSTGNESSGIEIYIESIYTENDIEEGKNVQINTDNTEIESENNTEESDPIAEVLGKLFMIVVEGIRSIYGDGPQILINTIQTSTYSEGLSKFVPWEIETKPEEIIKDTHKNAYVDISIDGKDEGTPDQKKKKVLASENGFDEETPIPIIPVDLYTMAAGKVSAFDVNFLTGQNNTELHSSGSAWIIIRNLAAGLIHVSIYIGSAFLLATLILHGIHIVYGSYIKKEEENPEEKKEHIEGLHKFALSVLLLIGTIIIMALCIFISDMFFEDMKVTETMEFPIRVVLKDSENIYSFSTNAIGYVRYMSEIQDVGLLGKKIMYTAIYIILVDINVIAVLVMFVRFIILIILSVIGPLIGVAYALDKKKLFHLSYQQWIIHYGIWSSFQVLMAIVYRIILKVAF